MKVVQMVFSPTGGVQKAVDGLLAGWAAPVVKVDLTNPAADDIRLEKEDMAFIAVPSYGGRVPALAARRLAKIQGNGARCAVVCVYGNRAYEDTLIELKDLAEQRGFQVAAAVSAVAEHSIMRQYASGRPDRRDLEELSRFGKEIFGKISSPQPSGSTPQVPGNRPYKKAGGAGLTPKATGACVSCGLCAEQCPAQAISRGHFKTADSEKCISCMRCVVRCPKSARKVNGVMVSIAALAIKKACSGRKENELFL